MRKQRFSRKAEGLTMQTVVIAFLVLLVLVILVYILGKNVILFTGKSNSCLSRPGGYCVDKRQGCNVMEEWSMNNPSDCDDDQVCCVPIKFSQEDPGSRLKQKSEEPSKDDMPISTDETDPRYRIFG